MTKKQREDWRRALETAEVASISAEVLRWLLDAADERDQLRAENLKLKNG